MTKNEEEQFLAQIDQIAKLKELLDKEKEMVAFLKNEIVMERRNSTRKLERARKEMRFAKVAQQSAEDMLAEKFKPSMRYYTAHEVAEILEDVCGNAKPCHDARIGKWLPMYCDFTADTVHECEPLGVACWEQMLKNYDKRNEVEECE